MLSSSPQNIPKGALHLLADVHAVVLLGATPRLTQPSGGAKITYAVAAYYQKSRPLAVLAGVTH
jgi:hypothetical protein